MKRKVTLKYFQDERLAEMVKRTGHRMLGVWARECAERVMPLFEERYPDDARPRNALETLQRWIDTGEFRMSVIRGASLGAHAAAREAGTDTPARSAARAAGQAVATAHVPRHSIGAAMYVLQAVYRTNGEAEREQSIAAERDWQYRRLLELAQQPEETGSLQ